jgi:peptidoglycan/LPS O-acetylase OafA/YrhL
MGIMERQVGPADRLGASLHRPRIPGLDFLRAIAVLLVLLGHSGIDKFGPVMVFDAGFGVQIFFVLSGFLITWGLLNERDRGGHISLGNFYRRRAARLLPAFYAYLLIGLILLLILGREIPWAAVLGSAMYVVNYVQAFTGAPTHYLSHCWSLAVEEQFYILWPLLFMLATRRNWHLVATLAIVVLTIWLLRPLYIAAGVPDEYLYRALETRGDQLAMGCLLAASLRTPSVRTFFLRLARPAVVLALLTCVVASTTLLHDSLWQKYAVAYALEPTLAALLIPSTILAASADGLVARTLNSVPMVHVGQVSYGVYLFHPLLVTPARHVLETLHLPSFIAVLGAIGLVIFVATLSYRYFESPLRARFRSA